MPPQLILLPGLHATSALFNPLCALIPPEIPTYIITYPTAHPSSHGSLFQQIQTQLQNQSDLILIAESFSGHLALKFAVAHPHRVRALVLCVSFIAPPVPRILCFLATPLVLVRFPPTTLGIRTFLSGMRAPRSIVQDLKRELRSLKPAVLAHRIRQAAHINATDALKQCRVPILCLAASHDRLLGPRSIRRIHKIRPDIPIKSLPGPHLLLQTHPTQVWQEISQFLTALPAPTPATA